MSQTKYKIKNHCYIMKIKWLELAVIFKNETKLSTLLFHQLSSLFTILQVLILDSAYT